MKKTGVFCAAVWVMLLGVSGASAADACLIEQKSCTDLHQPKYTKMLNILKKPASQYVGADSMTASVIYSTFEDLQKKANKGCSNRDKVSLDGFKPLFILGSGSQKRALLMNGPENCAWVKVK